MWVLICFFQPFSYKQTPVRKTSLATFIGSFFSLELSRQLWGRLFFHFYHDFMSLCSWYEFRVGVLYRKTNSTKSLFYLAVKKGFLGTNRVQITPKLCPFPHICAAQNRSQVRKQSQETHVFCGLYLNLPKLLYG